MAPYFSILLVGSIYNDGRGIDDNESGFWDEQSAGVPDKAVSAIVGGKAAIGGLPVDDFGKGAASGAGEHLGTIINELGIGVGGTQ